MGRETAIRKPGTSPIQTQAPELGTQVHANQSTVAPERDTLSRVADALAGFAPSVHRRDAEQYRQQTVLEEGRKDLDAYVYSSQTRQKGLELLEEWKDDEDASQKINQFFTKSIDQIPDEDLKMRVSKSLLAYQNEASTQLMQYQIKRQEQDDIDKLTYMVESSIDAGGFTEDGIKAFLQFGSTELGLDKRQLGGIVAKVAADQGVLRGQTDLIKTAQGIVIDDVPLGTSQGDLLNQALLRADSVAKENFIEANREERLKYKELASTGGISKRAFKQLRESNPNLFTGSEWESLYMANLNGRVKGVEGNLARSLYAMNRLGEAPHKQGQMIMEEEIQKAVASGKSTPEIIKMVADQGMTLDRWKATMDHLSINLPDQFDGKNVPQDALVALELYKEMRKFPSMLDKHVKNPRAKDFLNAFYYSQEHAAGPDGKGVSVEDAYAKALHIATDKSFNSEIVINGQKEIASAISDILDEGWFRDAKNPSDIQPILKRGVEYYVRMGADIPSATEAAKEDYLAKHKYFDGAYVYTGGRGIPQEAEEVKLSVLSQHGLDEDEYSIRPLPDHDGIWMVWDMRTDAPTPTNIIFNFDSVRSSLIKTPAQLSDDFNAKKEEREQWLKSLKDKSNYGTNELPIAFRSNTLLAADQLLKLSDDVHKVSQIYADAAQTGVRDVADATVFPAMDAVVDITRDFKDWLFGNEKQNK